MLMYIYFLTLPFELSQKLENAQKTNILSLSEHKLETIPEPVLQ
jgi:hypothetical protein